MPTTGPVYNLIADRYEGLLKVGLKFPITAVLISMLAALPLWWLATHMESGFMPDMDEGAFVLDYHMPVGTSLVQTDKVLRRVEEVLQNTPDISGYIRRTGAELGFFATESYTGDILVSLKPAGERRPASELFDVLREEIKAEVPELETEFVPLVQDQINDLAGVASPIEVKVFGPDFAKLRELAEQVGEIVEKVDGVQDMNAHVLLGNPDVVIRPDSLQTARVGLTELDIESQLNAALYGQVASTVPEQDRMTKIRVRYPDRVRFDRDRLGLLPISLATATPPAILRRARQPPPEWASFHSDSSPAIRTVRSPNELTRENQQPVITVSAELGKRDLGSVNRDIQEKLSKLKFPPGYRWELAGSHRWAARVICQPAGRSGRVGGTCVSAARLPVPQPDLPLLIFLAQPISLASAFLLSGSPARRSMSRHSWV